MVLYNVQIDLHLKSYLLKIYSMERFERVMNTLIIEEDIDYNDIIKAIESVTSDYEQEKILEELCSYADPYLTPDDIL